MNDFVNESQMNVTRNIIDTIKLNDVKMRCFWDGEHWYYYERENKGSVEEFKQLQKNQNATFEIYVTFDFEQYEGNKYKDDICKVESMCRMHWFNMVENDYEIEPVYCKNVETLSGFLSDYEDADNDRLRELLSDTWDENNLDEELMNEITDRMGIKDNYELVSKIKDIIINDIIENCE